MTIRTTPTWSTDSGSSESDAEVARVGTVQGLPAERLRGPPGRLAVRPERPRYTRSVTRTYVAVVVVEVVVLAALWLLSRHFAA